MQKVALFQHFCAGSDIRTNFISFLNFGEIYISSKIKFYNIDYRMIKYFQMRFFLLTLCLISGHVTSGEDIVIQLEKGSIKGAKKDFDNGKSFYLQFLGIKYAQAPTGPLRFMVSQRPRIQGQAFNTLSPHF